MQNERQRQMTKTGQIHHKHKHIDIERMSVCVCVCLKVIFFDFSYISYIFVCKMFQSVKLWRAHSAKFPWHCCWAGAQCVRTYMCAPPQSMRLYVLAVAIAICYWHCSSVAVDCILENFYDMYNVEMAVCLSSISLSFSLSVSVRRVYSMTPLLLPSLLLLLLLCILLFAISSHFSYPFFDLTPDVFLFLRARQCTGRSFSPSLSLALCLDLVLHECLPVSVFDGAMIRLCVSERNGK